MALPVLPLAVGGLAALVLWRHARKAKLTPAQRAVYETARDVKDPAKLRAIADAFESQGFKEEANLLRKRAALRELPPATTIARRKAFRQGLSSKDPVGVLKLADAFDKEGATGAAAELRKYAASLQVAQGQQPTATTQGAKS